MRKICMADPFFSAADRERIHAETDAILDGSLSMGPNVKAFEAEFATLTGVSHAIAMNSCTSALEAALLAFGPADGREVILPAETFIATGAAVCQAGYRPVFAEVSAATLCLELADVAARVTDQTRGVVLVHMAGLITPDIVEFRDYCDSKGLFLIEDAAHAPGAKRGGKRAGAFGHAGCFSFFPTKVMTAGEGGMLTTDDDALAARVRSLQHRGRNMQSDVEEYSFLGKNIRMTEFAALIGRVQLSHLDEYLGKRQALAECYRRELAADKRVTPILSDQPEASSYWKLPVLLPPTIDRAATTQRMAAAGVAVDASYQPALHLQPAFRQLIGTCEGLLPRTEALLSRHLCLPCHPRMTEDDVAYVASTLSNSLDALAGSR